MEKKFYNAKGLEKSLSGLEARFGMPSTTFYAHYLDNDEVIDAVPRFVQGVWASLYRDYKRMCGDDGFAQSVETI